MEEGPEAVKTDGRPGAGKGHHYKKQAQGPEVAQAGVANGVLSVQDDPRKAQDYSEEHPHVPGADEPLPQVPDLPHMGDLDIQVEHAHLVPVHRDQHVDGLRLAVHIVHQCPDRCAKIPQRHAHPVGQGQLAELLFEPAGLRYVELDHREGGHQDEDQETKGQEGDGYGLAHAQSSLPPRR